VCDCQEQHEKPLPWLKMITSRECDHEDADMDEHRFDDRWHLSFKLM